MLFGLIRPDAGTIRVFGRPGTRPASACWTASPGFIESPKFYPYLTGRQNLEGLALLDGGARPGLLEEVLDIVDLADRADDKVGGYSYGMRQRLGVAASLLRDPRLLVLDEPANGLDPAGIRDMRALVKRLADSGLTVLLSSHDMDEVEEICDNVTIMRRGLGGLPRHASPSCARWPPTPATCSAPPTTRARSPSPRDHPDGARSTARPGRRRWSSPARSDAGLGVRRRAGARRRRPARASPRPETPLEALFFMLTDDQTDRRHRPRRLEAGPR